VFVLQVFLVALVASLPLPASGSVLFGTLIHATVLAGLWLMVRHRVWFGVIPR
jgi:hypothetical protein